MKNQLSVIQQSIAKNEKSFLSVLPPHVPSKKFMRTAVSAAQNNPAILDCEPESIVQSCQKAALDGLILDGREAALVPFKGKATYMPMVAGILKRAKNSGYVTSLSAHVVYEKDQFEYHIDENGPHIIHRPHFDGDAGKPRLAYAVAKLKDSGTQIEVMTASQIDKRRRASRNSDRGPWKDWPDEMWRKTVLRALCKYLPSSPELETLFDHDDDNFDMSKPVNDEPARQSAADINADLSGGDIIDSETVPEYTEEEVII